MTRRMTLAIVIVLGVAFAAAAGEKPLKVCMLSGAWEYESQKSLPILREHLEKRFGAECKIVQAKKKQGDDVPGMEALDEADVMVLFMRRQSLKGEQLERFKAWCEKGKPIVGIRTASHAIQTWLEFDKLVLGGNYKGHYGRGTCKVTIADEGRKHPILKGVEPFDSKGSLYRNTGLSKHSQVLMYGEIPDHREPVAWAHAYKGGRIFYTSLGCQADFQNEHFLRLLTNAVFWAAKREPATR